MMRMGAAISGAVMVAVVLGAGTARAEYEVLNFRSPTGNIHCSLVRLGAEKFALCEIREFVQTYKTPPADCELDWGGAFSVADRGRGMLACHGDTIQSNDSLVLAYGKSVELFGISCRSERTGITCQNSDGGGFVVSRARQRVF